MKNQVLRCECVDMSNEGLGIAKSGNLVIFVKGMIKGEIADVKIIAEKKNYSYGIIDKLIVKSAHRVASDCPISYKCGGCDFRYIDYQYQLVLKKGILNNTFKGFNVKNIIGDDNPYFYRNKVQMPIKDHKIGFYRKYSNDIVENEECLIESAISNSIIADLKPLLISANLDSYIRHILIKHAQGTNEIMLAFIVNSFEADFSKVVKYIVKKYPQICSVILNLNNKKTNVILGDEEKVLYGNSYIYDIFDGIKVKLSLKAFYQVNYQQMLKLYEQVKLMANASENDRILDLYCGIGTISLYMARYVKEVMGIEIVKQAIDNAKENAVINGINNATFILADASKQIDGYLNDIDIVIVDPPRKGLSEELINSLIEYRIPKIVYVSCNPATMNRDLNLFKSAYDVGDIQPVDMFPFTVHVENVVLLSKKDLKQYPFQ